MPDVDIGRVKRNIGKMIDGGASESEIDFYINSEGTSLDAVRSFKAEKQGPEQPEGEKMSTARAGYEGLLSGATLNFRDELKGAGEASGLPEAMFPGIIGTVARPGIGAARLGYEYLTGKGDVEGSATKTYETARDAQRSITKAAEEYAPVTNLLGNIAGSVALPGGAALKGAGLGARTAYSAATGAVAGGLSGVGEGTDLESRLTEGGKGAALGGAIGGVVAPVIAGASRVPGVVRKLIGSGDPEEEALRALGGAYQRDVARDPTAIKRMTDAEYARTPDAAAIDLGGEETRRLARGARNRSPEADFELTQAIDPRYERQGPRVKDFLENNVTFTNAKAQEAALESSRKAALDPAYEAVYAKGADGLWSPRLEQLATTDIVGNAMKKAVGVAKDEAVRGGYGGMQPKVSFREPSGTLEFAKRASGGAAYPDLKFWDLTRRQVRNQANMAARAGDRETASRANSFANALNEELDNLVPEFKQVRATGKGFFDAEDALDAGRKFARAKGVDIDEGLAQMGKMNATDQKLFKDGFLTEYVAGLGDVANRRDILNKVYASENSKKQLAGVLGPAKTAELEATLRVEGLMNLPRKVLTGHSSTAQQLLEQGTYAGVGGAVGAAYSGDYKGATLGVLTGMMKRRQHQFGNKVADEIGRKLASQDPTVFQQGIKLLASKPAGLQVLRDLDAQIAKVAGAQSE